MEKVDNKTEKKSWSPDDILVGLAVIAFGVSILAQVPGSYGDVMLFPKLVAIVALACGALIIATTFWKPSARAKKGFRDELYCIAISAFMFAMMAAAEHLGFFACLFVICFVVNQLIAVFCREGGMKSIARSLAVSIVMCGFTFVVFRILLGILTPDGISI